jgi:hypothetical protein
VSGCTWPLAGRLEGRTCGRDIVSPRGSHCSVHYRMHRETMKMGRRRAEEPEELNDDDLETEAEDLDEAAPAPRRARPVAKAARATPEETRALDQRIFAAADKLQAKLGRPATLPEIADAAKVPGSSADARRMRVGKALRRRGLLTAASPKAVEPGPGDKGYRSPPLPFAAPPAQAKRVQSARVVSPTLIEALVAERDRLATIVAHLDGTIAALGGAS